MNHRTPSDWQSYPKPPMGLVPRFIRECERLGEIEEAIARYKDASKPIPTDWLSEYTELASRNGQPALPKGGPAMPTA